MPRLTRLRGQKLLFAATHTLQVNTLLPVYIHSGAKVAPNFLTIIRNTTCMAGRRSMDATIDTENKRHVATNLIKMRYVQALSARRSRHGYGFH